MADQENNTPEIEDMTVDEVEEYISDMSFEEANELFGDDERKGVEKLLEAKKESEEETEAEGHEDILTKAKRRGLYRPNKDGKVEKVEKKSKKKKK